VVWVVKEMRNHDDADDEGRGEQTCDKQTVGRIVLVGITYWTVEFAGVWLILSEVFDRPLVVCSSMNLERI
jgi:hypothetical protein